MTVWTLKEIKKYKERYIGGASIPRVAYIEYKTISV